MAPLPTASRIFADRYLRETRRLERLQTASISPGTQNWPDALHALYGRMANAGSPIKKAWHLKRAIAYLQDVRPADGAHVGFAVYQSSRAAFICFASFSADNHPFADVDEDGLRIMQHMLGCDRHGGIKLLSNTPLAYLSRHALGRLHERDATMTRDDVTGIAMHIGALGYLVRGSEKHRRGQLCLHAGGTLLVGALKHPVQEVSTGKLADGTFLDIRTALPIEEVCNTGMVEQGAVARHVVAAWLDDDRSPDPDQLLAERIPFSPRREDYTLRPIVSANGGF